jgi:hypothetical protein
MTPGSFPDRGQHGEEPEDDIPVPEQGLFVCLPAEELTLEGFAQDGRADTMAPGALLATLLEAITGEGGSGLAGLADDQLIGIISAARRMESRTAWMLMSALAELARRRPPTGEPMDTGRDGFSDYAPDEVAGELRLSVQSAADQIFYAVTVAGRLPRSFAALAAGKIHAVHLRIIEDETSILTPEQAAEADAILAEAAQSKTFGELRYAAHRLILKLDPDAARKRKEQAAKHLAEVRRFREASGNAGMIAQELPPDEVLASWQHLDQRAHDLRAAGMAGSLRELRIQAYLDLLQERDSRLAHDGPDTGQSGRPDGPASGTDQPPDQRNGPGGNGGLGPEPGSPGEDDGAGSGLDSGPGGNAGPGFGPHRDLDGTGPPSRARQGDGPSVAALVNITVPLSTLLGLSATPGEAAGFGMLDADEARGLVAAAARHPDTRWCVTALQPDGTAAAHGCARGRHPPPPGTAPGPDLPDGTRLRDHLAGLRIRMAPVARGHCDHTRAEPGYRPSRALAHLVKVRNTRCTAPGCGRPAARCDLDHTLAWDQGGITCECDLAPLCRHHHRCKQSQGWKLEQPSPGVLVWRTPAGRSYTTTPTAYPV